MRGAGGFSCSVEFLLFERRVEVEKAGVLFFVYSFVSGSSSIFFMS